MSRLVYALAGTRKLLTVNELGVRWREYLRNAKIGSIVRIYGWDPEIDDVVTLQALEERRDIRVKAIVKPDGYSQGLKNLTNQLKETGNLEHSNGILFKTVGTFDYTDPSGRVSFGGILFIRPDKHIQEISTVERRLLRKTFSLEEQYSRAFENLYATLP